MLDDKKNIFGEKEIVKVILKAMYRTHGIYGHINSFQIDFKPIS